LLRKVEAVCIDATPLSHARTIDGKKRNRHETRTVAVFDPATAVTGTDWEPHVAAIIQVHRSVLTFQPATGLWKTTSETSFYLSNALISADQAANAVRGHWEIENGLHYVRDVTMGEDASRIRFNPGIFARFRSFAYNILRFNQHGTIKQDRYANALGGFTAIADLRLCQEN
jgi:hypothetical protein